MKKLVKKIKKRADSLKIEIRALYLAYTGHRLGWCVKILAAAVVAYALSPIDLIPDFIPVLGLLDDLILLPLGIALLIKLIPPEIMTECRKEASMQNNKKLPQNYFMAVLIVSVWVFIITFAAIKIAAELR